MITEIAVTNEYNQELTFSMDGSSGDSRYRITDIQGLNPVDAAISSSNSLIKPGSIFQAALQGNRNIILKLGYAPDYGQDQTIEDLRFDLYKLFPTKRMVSMVFSGTKTEDASISGYVEKVEPVIFTMDPEISISIICVDPLFMGVATTRSNFVATDPYWVISDYKGTSPVGFEFVCKFTKAVSNFHLRAPYHQYQADMDIESSFNTNDLLTIRTYANDREIFRTRSGVDTPLVTYISDDNWIELVPQLGWFNSNRFTAGVDGESTPPFTAHIDYQAAYGGL